MVWMLMTDKLSVSFTNSPLRPELQQRFFEYFGGRCNKSIIGRERVSIVH